jgi:hypothetical protein
MLLLRAFCEPIVISPTGFVMVHVIWAADNEREHSLSMSLLLLECGHARDEVAAGAFEQMPERPATSRVCRLQKPEGEIV